ncbi:hypothetical protein [Neisseria bergeri]|uniref:hypothetical protein n=1 Tax=Neisseria bergeri TaxID=1906581 RepID=UPI0027E1238C|nr:hypothetical protein [Neisseria bergeri]
MPQKTVYQLDTQNLYIGSTGADPDPLNPENWLIPAGCIETAPPEIPEHHAARWTGEGWEILEDLRGQTAYRTSDGGKTDIEEVGVLPEGLTLIPRPSDYHEWDGGSWVLKPTAQKKMLQEAKSEKLAEINRAAQSYIDRVACLDKVPEFEVATWTTQAFEAKAWHADQNAATPTLDAIAASRGVPPDALRQKAYEKTLKFERLTAYVAGLRQAAEDKINVAANLDELADISLVFDLKAEAG